MVRFGLIFETFDRIEATPGTNEKLALLEGLIKATAGDSTLEEIIRYTYNPWANYFVTPDMPSTGSQAAMSDEQLADIWTNVKLALEAMAKRELSGNDAKRAMQMVLEALPALPRKYFYAIFNRDLRIGMATGTFAKYFQGLVATSKPFLCTKFDAKADRNLKTISFPVYAETKFDGIRGVVIVDEMGIPTALSRELKPLFNTELVMDAIKKANLRSVVLDGEFGIPEDFTLTNAVTRTQKIHPARKNMKYFVFDAMPLGEWLAAKGTMKIEERKMFAATLIAQISNPLVVNTVSILCNNADELKAAFALFVEQGFEGVVMKRVGSFYKFTGKKTGTDWMKWKPIEEADVVVTGAERGDSDGWANNTCGKLLFKGYVELESVLYYIEGKVGSGLTVKQRDEYWKQYNAGTVAGKVIEIEYQEPCAVLDQSGREVIEYNAKGERIWSLRFPIFKRERPDKSVTQVIERVG